MLNLCSFVFPGLLIGTKYTVTLSRRLLLGNNLLTCLALKDETHPKATHLINEAVRIKDEEISRRVIVQVKIMVFTKCSAGYKSWKRFSSLSFVM